MEQGSIKAPVKIRKTLGFRGLTLEQYFKGRSYSDNKTADHNSTTNDSSICEVEHECDETQQYLQETFEIHETDEDNYNENQQKNVKTPQFC
jgi:hypothetical protein